MVNFNKLKNSAIQRSFLANLAPFNRYARTAKWNEETCLASMNMGLILHLPGGRIWREDYLMHCTVSPCPGMDGLSRYEPSG